MSSPFRKSVFLLIAGSLTLVCPVSCVVVASFGDRPGTRWTYDYEIVLYEPSPNLAFVLNPGKFTLILPSSTGSMLTGVKTGLTYGSFELELFPFSLMGLIALSYGLGKPAILRWRRRKQGLCLECGYPKRGLTSDRCPECGTSFGVEQANIEGQK